MSEGEPFMNPRPNKTPFIMLEKRFKSNYVAELGYKHERLKK